MVFLARPTRHGARLEGASLPIRVLRLAARERAVRLDLLADVRAIVPGAGAVTPVWVVLGQK